MYLVKIYALQLAIKKRQQMQNNAYMRQTATDRPLPSDHIRLMIIVWRLKRKIIRTVLWCVCVLWYAHKCEFLHL